MRDEKLLEAPHLPLWSVKKGKSCIPFLFLIPYLQTFNLYLLFVRIEHIFQRVAISTSLIYISNKMGEKTVSLICY